MRYHLYTEQSNIGDGKLFKDSWLNNVYNAGYTDVILSFYDQNGSPKIWEGIDPSERK